MTLQDRNFKQKNAEHIAQATKNNVLAFVEADVAFKNRLEKFLADHSEEVMELDNLREKRNRVRDEAERDLRRDAELTNREKLPDDATSLQFGPFIAQKKLEKMYIPETFMELAKRQNLQQSLIDGAVIKTTVSIDFKNATEYLRKNNLEKVFAAAYDAKEMTPAVTGPKDIPPFGAEVKNK